MKCNLCPRMCSAERSDYENKGGFCKMPLLPTLAKVQLHHWEEPVISGKNGSGTVFFSGCSLGCVFCQNEKISHKNFGKSISVERLAEIFRELEEAGAHNINLVSPSHFVPVIIKALDIYRPQIPIVYNSSGYECVETLRMLVGYVDIYLLDFKYYSSERALIYSNAVDYPSVAKSALLEAYRQQPDCVFKDGIMQKGIIVRHLLMPQGTADAIAVFDWVRENIPNVYFSIMSQYTPTKKALKTPVINRRITKREYQKVVSHILDSGFENCFVQKTSSATDKYIPEFNLYGI